jgi:hypothetical protein
LPRERGVALRDDALEILLTFPLAFVAAAPWDRDLDCDFVLFFAREFVVAEVFLPEERVEERDVPAERDEDFFAVRELVADACRFPARLRFEVEALRLRPCLAFEDEGDVPRRRPLPEDFSF